jgi:capsule polysaccharide export protein KpsE/RkpR
MELEGSRALISKFNVEQSEKEAKLKQAVDQSKEKDEKIRYLEQQVKTLETQMTVQAEQ